MARLRSGARAPRRPRTTGPEPVGFPGEALTLFHSQTHGVSGAQYEPLARIALS